MRSLVRAVQAVHTVGGWTVETSLVFLSPWFYSHCSMTYQVLVPYRQEAIRFLSVPESAIEGQDSDEHSVIRSINAIHNHSQPPHIATMYSHVSESENGSSRRQSDESSIASSKRRFPRNKRVNSELSEPLTANSITSVPVDEESGADPGDPYFVFRADLKKKLELVDESLAEYLRVVNETVSKA